MEMLDPPSAAAPLLLVVEDDEDTREVLHLIMATETPYRTLLML